MEVPPFKFAQWDGKVLREISRLRVKRGATLDPDIFRSEARPLAGHAEAWIAAYRLTQEGQRFPGVTRNLQWSLGLSQRAGQVRISA